MLNVTAFVAFHIIGLIMIPQVPIKLDAYKTWCTVVLTRRNIVLQAKKFVEELPQNVKEKASKEEAETVKKALEAVGGTVEIET